MTSRAACLSQDRPAGGRRRLLAAWCYLRGGSAQGPVLPWPTGRQSPRSNGQFPSLAARRADSDGPPCGEARRTAVAPLGARAVSPRHHSQYPGAMVSTTSNQHKLILRGPAAPASGSQYPYVCARSSGAMIVRDPCPPMQLGLRASVTCWRASAACVRPIRLGPGPVARLVSGLSFPTSEARRPGPSGPTRVSRCGPRPRERSPSPSPPWGRSIRARSAGPARPGPVRRRPLAVPGTPFGVSLRALHPQVIAAPCWALLGPRLAIKSGWSERGTRRLLVRA